MKDLYETLSQEVALLVEEQLKQKPNSCLALPTGRSPLGCYKLLALWSQEKRMSWSQARCFALDDYLDVDESVSFQNFLETHLYRYTNLPVDQRYNPLFTDDYDEWIEKCGGLDLTILGLGNNGHIAFNEPFTPRLSWTHGKWLTKDTRVANQYYFEGVQAVPFRAITMGISTILSSRKIILIVHGKHKRDILEKATSGIVNSSVPASFLTLHPHLTILTDFQFHKNNVHPSCTNK